MKKRQGHQSTHAIQLKFEASVVQYVNWLAQAMKATQDTKHGKRLKAAVPLYGPRFVPPMFDDISLREAAPIIEPEAAYLKPITTVHPVFFPELKHCPRDNTHENMVWDGWTSTGSCEIHGLLCEEKALGFQLRCSDCAEEKKRKNGDKSIIHCYATTNELFWQNWEHWEIPGMSLIAISVSKHQLREEQIRYLVSFGGQLLHASCSISLYSCVSRYRHLQ
ncbi:uncharacterized protein PHACADRAFT_265791 [Phanerochaete carnosa HHB-10118-sp]|uniref:Uncharacterized protein n=1 Tax=Phanerochaete carnosa (strain HHB-10118-sp) TaxID=650164 RepID=K5VQX5_PHACS|nr:uncharacterized protein PHACADRAFT_265791 [Phanerochaete carnosa HHB-10118-sp]EKM49145.1 hypothetical protein PHACADRAFT_265791 [Phanerochaete carnosa HHB-10118-sp]